jgi:hypothetical protein
MPPAEQEENPDFENHPVYSTLFQTLITSGQSREQATQIILEVSQRAARENERLQQAAQQPLLPQQPPQQPGDNAQPREHNQPGQQGQEQPQLPDQQGEQGLPPFQPRDPEPQGLLFFPNQDGAARDNANKGAPQLPPIDMKAKSIITSLLRPSTFALEKFRKYEYVPLWYFTEQGCQSADKEREFSEDIWDFTRTSDDRIALRAATANRPSSYALSDEQLTWEQFMEANRLFCRWLIPGGWPENYAKLLINFFWQIESDERKTVPRGKDTLLLYQARIRKAWHDELKMKRFFNLVEIDEQKMNVYRQEVDGKYNDAYHKAVSHSTTRTQNEELIKSLPNLLSNNQLHPAEPPNRHVVLRFRMTAVFVLRFG